MLRTVALPTLLIALLLGEFPALAAAPARVRQIAPGDPLPGDDLAARATAGLDDVAARIGLPKSAIARYTPGRLQPIGRGGIAVLHATAGGVPVIDGDLSIAIDATGRLVGWSAGPAVGLDLRPSTPKLDAAAAVARLTGRDPGPATSKGEWRVFANGDHARPVALSVDGFLRRSWQVEYRVAGRLWQVVLDADDGSELSRLSLTASDTFRVWADDAGDLRPHDGPLVDFTPHPSGVPDGEFPAISASSLVTTNGFDVFGDPWLPPGATAAIGNNAVAYADRALPSGLGAGDVASGISSPDAFDWPYDFDQSPTATPEQAQPGIDQAFYTVNWLHDWFYAAGFDEAAGTAQASSYGRGGVEGDPMLVEIQDDFVDQRNNANMSTPSDGFSPTLQVYLWDRVEVDVDGAWLAVPGIATFGPQVFDVTATAAEVGSDPLACTGIDAPVAGKVAVIDRGTCTFVQKVATAQAAGAVGVVIVNYDDAVGAMDGTDGSIAIPVVELSSSSGADLRAQMALGPADVRLVRSLADGALDSSVLAHEWGHYLFFRSIPGCASVECDGLSEGNSDFVALTMVLRDGDDRDGAYPLAQFSAESLSDDPAYFGIRRAPYSRDPSKNALTFRDIASGQPLPTIQPILASGDNTEAHNVGEIWASAAFDAYLALQDDGAARGLAFTDVERAMDEILVAGLALTPYDPGLLDARDALLLAAEVVDPADPEVMADAFAGRGMGTCAVGPAPGSTDLSGVVEDFSLDARGSLANVALVPDPAASCDGDDVLDGGEQGTVNVDVIDASAIPLVGGSVEISVDPAVPGLTFPSGGVVAVPDVPAYGVVTVSVPVALDASLAASGPVKVTATLTAADACEGGASVVGWPVIESDEASAASTTDDFSVDDGSWTSSGDGASDVWARAVDPDTGEASWIGLDSAFITDTRLESPVLSVDGDLVITLTHRYAFEASGGTDWDGGVLELSVDGGPYSDVSAWGDPGYTGVLTGISYNPLGGRPAFTGANPSWPAFDTLALDLGSSLVGHDVRLSLRIGTDEAATAWGWEITEIAATGISNLPFPGLSADATTPPSTYQDGDGDGFGDAATAVSSCSPVAGIQEGGDCDDADPAVSPSASELCDGIDDDCDGTVDQGAVDASTFAADADADGFTSATDVITACDAVDGYVTPTEPADCDDADATVRPGATDVPGDGIDQDCSGADAAGDGTVTVVAGEGCGCDASGGPGTAALGAWLAAALLVRRRK